MVFQFEHVGLDHGGAQVGRPPAADARPQGVVRPLADGPGRRRLELPLLGQPRPAAGGLPVRRRLARASAATRRPAWPRCCTCTAGRRTSTRARRSGWRTTRSRPSRTSPTSSRSTTTCTRSSAGEDPAHVLAALRPMSRDNARTPVQWDGSPTRRLHHRDAVAAGQPRPRRVERRGASGDDPTSVLAHYRRLIALRHDDPVVALGDFTHAAARARRGLRVHPLAGRRRRCSSSATCADAADAGRAAARGRRRRAGARQPARSTTRPVLAPWEARVLRLP